MRKIRAIFCLGAACVAMAPLLVIVFTSEALQWVARTFDAVAMWALRDRWLTIKLIVVAERLMVWGERR